MALGAIERLHQSARDFLPRTALAFSGNAILEGVSLYRFNLNQTVESRYSYYSHMIALPLSGGGSIEWKCEGRSGQNAILPHKLTIQPANSFAHRCTWRNLSCATLHIDPRRLVKTIHENVDSDEVELLAHVCIDDTFLRYLITSLMDVLEYSREMSYLRAESIYNRIAVLLLERYSARPTLVRRYRHGLSTSRLAAVVSLVEQQASDRITLEEMARAAGGMSVFHFCRAFNKALGVSPYQYVIRERLRRGHSLLKAGKTSVSEVALITGFSDQSHFCRLFKKIYGISPAKVIRTKAHFVNIKNGAIL